MTPAEEVAQAEKVQRNPVPSLLRSLLTDHLDPGYADEARLRAAGERTPRSRSGGLAWLVAGTVVVGLVFGVSAAHQTRRAPDTMAAQQQIADDVRIQQSGNDALARDRDALAIREAAKRTANLAGDAEGRRILGELRVAEMGAAAVAVTGPGIRVDIGDPPARPDLTDKGRPGGAERGQVILDHDLQAVVNALWASGAEAIAIDGVRVGPGASIRQAGGAILVDNQPVTSPYALEAIGDAGAMQAAYIVSPGYLRLQPLQQLYGATVAIESADSLQLAEAPTRDLRYAHGS
ncbi:DUF881 domain-containing protein [Tomitella biformata]|uniref:DUF881 domain-containing protein n=1 Tax=Tomitella biformata TaxID=630403 RepID=UPI000465AB29|nr:DUF881 domain-containing protein [Tomitella biformata]